MLHHQFKIENVADVSTKIARSHLSRSISSPIPGRAKFEKDTTSNSLHQERQGNIIPSAPPLGQGRGPGLKATSPITPEEISSPEALAGMTKSPCPTSGIEYFGHNTSVATDGNVNDGDTGEKPRAQIFACPYLRQDPVRHKSCLNLRLKRIRDVKQHLQRRHCPQFYCPRCFATFSTRTRVHAHVRAHLCELREPPTSSEDSVSQEAQAALKRPASRKDHPQEQWCKIWKTLFPNRPTPINACLGSVVDEGMGMIRQFWAREGSGMVSKHFDLLECRRVDKQQLDGLVMRLLDDACGQLKQGALEPEEVHSSGKLPTPEPEKLLSHCGQTTHDSGTHTEEAFDTGLLDDPEIFGRMVDEPKTLLTADQTTTPYFTHCTKGSLPCTEDFQSLPEATFSFDDTFGFVV